MSYDFILDRGNEETPFFHIKTVTSVLVPELSCQPLPLFLTSKGYEKRE